MRKTLVKVCCAGLTMIAAGAFFLASSTGGAARLNYADVTVDERQRPIVRDTRFDVDVLVDGRTLEEYQARGRFYIEAIEGAEYELRVHNPLPYRVAVALSVDGLNSIDARRTSPWYASKWVIEPYGTIQIGGWQMSSDRARRFYFTSERDSYAAKLGQVSNLGVISAVFFREVRPIPVPIAPPPRPRPRPLYEEGSRDSRSERKSESPAASSGAQSGSRGKPETIAPLPDDEYAATGIGRSVRNDVRWVNMELDPHPAAELTLRYEYYPALVRLGILPRPYPRPDPLRRRESATGFEDRRFSPEP